MNATLVANVPEAGTEIDVVADDAEWVVFLHGLARSGKSMRKIAKRFRGEGYNTCIIDYPSTAAPIAALARDSVAPALSKCVPEQARRHFVTHSMGGIMVRQLVADELVANVGRVVMLSPPNHGSEVVDSIGDWRLFGWINGPAGRELGTDEQSVPNTLGPVTFETGVITGTRTINWINSLMIDGKDDGKVSVASARVDGMRDFRVIGATHTFIMRKRETFRLAHHFIVHGQFPPD
ncbi:MAG: alpha/beta fold hydrolase [Pseudomonadota bacterium]